MITPTSLIPNAPPAAAVPLSRRGGACGPKQKLERPRHAAPRATPAKSRPIRIARGEQVIGRWSFTEIKERIGNENLLLTDSFYDEDVSEWLPLAELRVKPVSVKVAKTRVWPCYCGTGLPFELCCGEGSSY